MRVCDGLVDSLLYVIKACVNASDFDSKVRTKAHLHAHTHTHARQLFHVIPHAANIFIGQISQTLSRVAHLQSKGNEAP